MPLQLPGFYEDPSYQPAQTKLATLGTELLAGKVPDYYKPIGQIGGQTFESMLRAVGTDIERGVTAQAARLGQRGGAPLEVAGREMARVAPALRWEDMMRGIEGRKGLLGMGAELTSGVRAAGLTAGAGRRGFELGKAELGIGQEQFVQKLALNREQFDATLVEEKEQFRQGLQLSRDKLEISQEQFDREMALKDKQLEFQKQQWEEQKEAQESQAKSQMWGQIIGGGIGAIGNIAGMGMYAKALETLGKA